MELDRETVWQLVVTAGVVAMFVVGLVVLSQTFVADAVVEEEPATGDLEGEFESLDLADGSASGTLAGELDGAFEGELDNDFTADVSGTMQGSTADGTVNGTFEGQIDGPLNGTISGDINGTIDEEAETFSGEFSGTVNGTTDKLSPDGGPALVGLLGAFIVVMTLFGYVLHTRDFEE
jgi:hypothetical protein